MTVASSTFGPATLAPPTPTDPSDALVPVSPEAPPSLADHELVGRIRNLFTRARSARAPILQQWQRNHRVMRNRTWTATLPEWTLTPEVPEVRPIIASCVAWLTDQRPTLELTPAAQPFSPTYDFYDELAQDMKTALNAAWVTYQWEAEIEKVAWDAYQFNIGFLKVGWDAALAHGLGDVSVRRRDPWTIYPDPQATCEDDMNYIIEARTVSLQELDRRFPGAAAKFDLYGNTESTDEMPRGPGSMGSFPRANPGAIAPATTARYGLPGQSRDHAAADETGVTLIECWLREHTIYDADGITKIYECWRCVCVAGSHVLLNKRATELFPFERHPYIRYTPEDMGEFYGQSMVELLTPSQTAINRLLAAMQSHAELVGNPIFLEDARAGIGRTKMTNRPGQRVQKNQGGQADWLKPPEMSALVSDLVKFYIGEMEKISGLSSISRGLVPGGRVASDVLDSVQESGFVRIRLALRNLEFSLRVLGQLTASIIGEFYTEGRLISMVGPSGEKTSRTLRANHFYIPTAEGHTPLRFSVLVYAGSMLPTSRQARISEADTLFAMNAIDRSALLAAHDWPNRHLIEERMAEMDAKGIVQGPSARTAAGRTS